MDNNYYYDYNDNQTDYNDNQTKTNDSERKGTVEEYVLFMMNYIEQDLEQRISGNLLYENVHLADRLQSIEERLNPSNETRAHYSRSYRYFVDNLEYIFSNFEVQSFFTYGSRQEWNEWTANKLSNILKNMAFFGRYKTYSSKKAAEDVERGLPGGKDPFTFILETPKVLQSPKVEPVLRMAAAKYIAENEDFGGTFFQIISCYLYDYGTTSILRPFLGLEQKDVLLLLDRLQDSYEGSLPRMPAGQTRDPEPWIDLADALIRETEKIDFDNLFYEFYAILLKTKHFLYRLDYDGGLVPAAMKLITSLEKPFVILTSGKWPTMWTAIKETIVAAKSDMFWKGMNKAFKEYSINYWEDDFLAPQFMIDFVVKLRDLIAKELKIKNNLLDFFKMSTTETGRKYFKITNYLNKIRENGEKSIFQPNMDIIDMRYFLKRIVVKLRSDVPEFVSYFEPNVSQLLKNIELNPADYDMVKNTKEEVLDTINEIMDRVIFTY